MWKRLCRTSFSVGVNSEIITLLHIFCKPCSFYFSTFGFTHCGSQDMPDTFNNPAALHIRAGERSVCVRVKNLSARTRRTCSPSLPCAPRRRAHILVKSLPPLEEAEMFQTLMTALLVLWQWGHTHSNTLTHIGNEKSVVFTEILTLKWLQASLEKKEICSY